MPEIPRQRTLDDTLALRRDPYGYVAARCRRHGADLFRTRLLFRTTICMMGRDASDLFYDPERFRRRGAAPEPVRATLFGKGGVQSLDGGPHRARKAMFMSLMSPGRIGELAERTREVCLAHARRWEGLPRVVLYDEFQRILTRAVADWAGVEIPPEDLERRTSDLVALFDAAGAAGPRHLRSRAARRRCERWIAGVVESLREQPAGEGPATPAYAIATHREHGELLDPRIASVELLNLLRPTVAVSLYMVFVAHALHEHPESRRALEAGKITPEAFVHEVRRFYPFFPAVLAVCREDFDWHGYRFCAGDRVLLDLHATNGDPRLWEAPGEFRPRRFVGVAPDPHALVPQGGGEHSAGHRCPGEWIIIELMKVAVDFLSGCIDYDVPEQDLELDRTRLPACPRSRMVISSARVRPPVGSAPAG